MAESITSLQSKGCLGPKTPEEAHLRASSKPITEVLEMDIHCLGCDASWKTKKFSDELIVLKFVKTCSNCGSVRRPRK
jgi:hypothetical protein